MDLADVFHWARQLWILWLMLLFAAVLWWAYRPKNRKRFEEDARIPFKDDNGGS